MVTVFVGMAWSRVHRPGVQKLHWSHREQVSRGELMVLYIEMKDSVHRQTGGKWCLLVRCSPLYLFIFIIFNFKIFI